MAAISKGSKDPLAQVVLPCDELDETLDFFTARLGFRVEAIYPADNPATVVLSGYGTRIELRRGGPGAPGVVRIVSDDPSAIAGGASELTAPNGTRVEVVNADPPLVVPDGSSTFVLTRYDERASWGKGRAGMQYRDLIPDRQGGRFIASHIRIPDGGPVPDYVHFHKIRFQMIYCYKGWVRVVYEDQGPPFVLEAGDCVLQPPRIRHRVLESSSGLEVIEIGCPANHETFADHALELPTNDVRPERDFGGQSFVRHVAAEAVWHPWRLDGFECRDTGIGAATKGLAGVRVARARPTVGQSELRHDGELLFLFALDGALVLERTTVGESHALASGDALVLPPGESFGVKADGNVELLEVALPSP